MMYNPQLETFVRVADAGSFSKAAEAAFITPTAVIKQINILEDDLGLTLFLRTHRGIVLTQAGESLYKDAKYLMQYAQDSIARARNAMIETEHIVRIGTSPMTPGQFLVELWPRIHERCPDIKFQLVPFENTPENAREILKNLGQNIDIVAGVYDQDYLASRGCAALELSQTPICAAVSVHHRLASKESLTIDDLKGETLMLIRRRWNSAMDALRDAMEQHAEVGVLDFDFYDVNVFNQCVNGHQVLMTIDYWKDIHPLLKVLPIEWEHKIPFGLFHSPTPSKTVAEFLDAVRAVLISSAWIAS